MDDHSIDYINQWHTRLRLMCHFFVLTTFWRHLWSITEQMHGNLESTCQIYICLKGMLFFCHKNGNSRHTKCLISTHPAEKITLACYACLCFFNDDDFFIKGTRWFPFNLEIVILTSRVEAFCVAQNQKKQRGDWVTTNSSQALCPLIFSLHGIW